MLHDQQIRVQNADILTFMSWQTAPAVYSQRYYHCMCTTDPWYGLLPTCMTSAAAAVHCSTARGHQQQKSQKTA